MLKKSVLLIVPLMAGCLTTMEEPEIRHWPIEYCGAAKASAQGASFGLVRLSQIVVRSTYDTPSLMVRRSNGTLEADSYNEFAAIPSAILRGLVIDAVNASGKFKSIVGGSSLATTDCSLEVAVAEFLLDGKDRKAPVKAKVSLLVRVVRGREIVKTTRGAASVVVEGNDFGKAFSEAASQSLDAAFKAL